MSKGYAVTNPATNEVVETFDTFTDEQIQDALAKSHEAFQTWRKTPIDERAKIVSRAAEPVSYTHLTLPTIYSV